MSIPLPTKPIEHATAHFSGDSTVGIFAHSYNLELFLDLSAFDEKDQRAILEKCRGLIEQLYGVMHGEPPTVTFDFELEHEQEMERRFDEPDYDTVKQPTPLENWQKNDEHHV